MKKLHVHPLAVAALLAASMFALTFVSCENDDDDDDDSGSSGSSVTLPASKGTNEFSGKTWRDSCGGTDGGSAVIAYTASTATLTSTYTEGGETSTTVATYNYSYDSESKLLYLALTKESSTYGGETYTWSSANEFKSVASKAGESGDELAKDVAEKAVEFAAKRVFKYTISGSTLTLTDYFDGTLPTLADFYARPSSLDIDTHDGGFEFDGESRYYLYPSFSAGVFSGTLYQRIWNDDGEKTYKAVGTASGTYTTSGTGTSGSTITLTFTALPDGVSDVTKDTAYTLTQRADESQMFTQQ